MDTAIKSYFKILKISSTATLSELKKAYKTQAKYLHPDTNHGQASTQAFQKLNEAYEVLSRHIQETTKSETVCTLKEVLRGFTITRDALGLSDTNYTEQSFYKLLSEFGLAKRSKECNDFNWVIKGEALQYGMNFIDKVSIVDKQTFTYTQKYFDTKEGRFKVFAQTTKAYRSKVLWDVERFSLLLSRVKNYKQESLKEKRSLKRSEETSWPHAICCHECGSENIKKVEKWERKSYQILSCECLECHEDFQEFSEYSTENENTQTVEATGWFKRVKVFFRKMFRK